MTAVAPAARIALIEDSSLVRERLVAQLRASPDLALVGYTETVGDALDLVTTMQPDAVILDLALRDGSGLAVLERIKELEAAPRVLVLTNHAQEEYRRQCRLLGADGFLDKSTEFDRVPATLRTLLGPGQVVDQTTSTRERFLRALVEHAWDGVALFTADGRITYGSASTTRILGYPLHEFVGRSAFDLIHPDSHEFVAKQLAAALANPGASIPVHARVRRQDGTWRLLEGVLTNKLSDPDVGAIVNNYRDVSEQRQLEEQLHQARKMEAIGHLAGGVAHDFNNLLTAITAYSELVLLELPAGHAARTDLEEVLRAADRAATLTRQLLAFSRRQPLEPRILDINLVVAGTERMLRRLIGPPIEIRCELDAEIGMIMADAAQLEQILLNLAVNARDAMPRGGRILIATSNVTRDATADGTPYGAAAGPYVCLSVTDTGVGMSPETLSHVFEPFFTTKKAGEGTGLGLATVYGIVQQNSGFVIVESEPEQGTTFRLHFPRVDQGREAQA